MMQLSTLAPLRLTWPTRLLFPIGLLLVAAVVGIVATAFYDVRQAEQRQAEQQIGNLALQLEHDLGRSLETFDLSLRAAREGMGLAGIAAMDPPLRQAILFDGALAGEGFDGIVVTDAAGTVMYDSMVPRRPLDISNSDYFQAARDSGARGLIVGRPVEDAQRTSWTLGMGRRLEDASGQFTGVVAGSLRLSYVQAMFDSLNMGKLGTISLFSLDGQVLARHPYGGGKVGSDASRAETFKRARQSQHGTFVGTATVDGVERVYAHRQVGGFPMVIVVGVATATIHETWASKTAIMAGALAVLLAIGAGLVWALKGELQRRTRAESAARHSEQRHADALSRLNALFQNSDDSMAVIRTDARGRLVFDAVNPVWERKMGVAAEAAVGQTPGACLPVRLSSQIVARWAEACERRRPVTFGFETEAGGRTLVWDEKIVPIPDSAGNVGRLITVSRDVTERKAADRKLEALNLELAARATTDSLTGLANRRRLDEAIDQEWRRAARDGSSMSMMMIDLDRFKLFNDRYGHPAGDACLRDVAASLGRFVRRPGDVAARYGGEELAILLPKTEVSDALALADGVRSAIQDLAIVHELNLPWGFVTGSIGVATIRPFARPSGGNANELISAADQALYEAKRGGRNRVEGGACTAHKLERMPTLPVCPAIR